ncbi:MAG TPA: hypothetical protein EYP85_04485 [Armatimonadetes bacterium]|nr:hypothetical protein [Armatimonadota bacterium]
MKLILAVVHSRDLNKVTRRLVQHGFPFTQVASTGGFLREGNATLLLGVADEQVEAVLELIRSQCETREQLVNALPATEPLGFTTPVRVTVGGAVVFVLNIERFEKM